jgi:tripartite-type tricarboxylate transporter receptor subunit TctC
MTVSGDRSATIKRGLFAALLAGVSALMTVGSAPAQTFPTAPVKLICDSAPGSANDVTARILADRLSAIWNQQVVVVNAPGAGGAIAARMASAAAPDGYTLFMPVTSEFYALAGAPDVAPNLPLKLERDFKSVGFVNRQPLFMGASHKARFKTMPEMLALAKEKPGSIAYATTGRGRLTHLAMELLQTVANVKFEMVSYTGGAAQAMPDITSGRVELVLEAYAGLAPAFRGDLVKGFGTTAMTRVKAFPDIQAIAETVPGFEVQAWGVLVAPLGTPDTLIAKINADLNKALADPGLIEKFEANGGETRAMTPAEMTAFVASEQAKMLPVLEKAMKTEP